MNNVFQSVGRAVDKLPGAAEAQKKSLMAAPATQPLAPGEKGEPIGISPTKGGNNEALVRKANESFIRFNTRFE
jgi:hypothetical protein